MAMAGSRRTPGHHSRVGSLIVPFPAHAPPASPRVRSLILQAGRLFFDWQASGGQPIQASCSNVQVSFMASATSVCSFDQGKSVGSTFLP